MEMHHFGSCICCQIRCRTGSIFITTRPATINKSACRGLNRIASAPKRAMSYLLAPVAMNSIPQHAVANGNGQRLFLRHQLARASSFVTTTFSGSEGLFECFTATETPLAARHRQNPPLGAQ